MDTRYSNIAETIAVIEAIRRFDSKPLIMNNSINIPGGMIK
jgi:hypothetical protein